MLACALWMHPYPQGMPIIWTLANPSGDCENLLGFQVSLVENERVDCAPSTPSIFSVEPHLLQESSLRATLDSLPVAWLARDPEAR